MRPASEFWIEKATEIVVACVSHNPIDPHDLPRLIREVRTALEAPLPWPHADLPAKERVDDALAGPNAAVPIAASVQSPLPEPSYRHEQIPAVSPTETITDEYLISLEDGKRYRSLKRHLMSRYGLTPDDYRQKWGLPADYPMVAPSYARERSKVAKRIGLGRSREGNTFKRGAQSA